MFKYFCLLLLPSATLAGVNNPVSGTGSITSVAGRTGTIVLAAGDVSGLAASATTDTTNAGNISSGTLPFARVQTGTSSSTVVVGNDVRVTASVAPPNSVVILLGDSYSAGYPVNSLDVTLGYANAYVGPGKCYAQWLSLHPFFFNIPIYSYGISAVLGTDSGGVGSATKILAGTGTLKATEYINGSVVGSYGGVTTVPSTLIASYPGSRFWVLEYGINDLGAGIAFSTYLPVLQSVCSTIHGYSGTNYIVATTVNDATNVHGRSRYTFNTSYKAQITGTITGIDNYADVGAAFNDSTDSQFYYDGTHLISSAYQVYGNIVGEAFARPTARITPVQPLFYVGGLPTFVYNDNTGASGLGIQNTNTGSGATPQLTLFSPTGGNMGGLNSYNTAGFSAVASSIALFSSSKRAGIVCGTAGTPADIYLNTDITNTTEDLLINHTTKNVIIGVQLTTPAFYDTGLTSTMAKFDGSHLAVAATAGTDYAAALTVQTGTLVSGTATKTVPAGCHPWVQDNAASLTNVGSLVVTTSGTIATITSTNVLDTSPFTLYNAGSQ